uniref:Uncharacterized protein n=1 Tax=Globodera pallida TaxID=36090 RepID=A0A183C6I0_GLOPA
METTFGFRVLAWDSGKGKHGSYPKFVFKSVQSVHIDHQPLLCISNTFLGTVGTRSPRDQRGRQGAASDYGGSAVLSGLALPMMFLLGGQKTGANEIGKKNEQPKPQSKGMKLRGGRRKRDVLGNAGGDVGGWDHPIDSSYKYGWENEGVKTAQPNRILGMKLRGGRRKRDVLGNAGGDVGGWDHPIDSS